jgi:voltage-dependent potassium channel beta subunit
MEYRNLGKWGLKISGLSVGGHADWGKNIDDGQTDAILVAAYDAGINYIDSAEKYADGRCEEVIAASIHKHGWARDTLILGTKVSLGGVKGASATQQGMQRKHLVEACEKSLRRYKTDHLDLLFCHRPDPTVPAEEVVTTMNRLIGQGKILYWGTSDHSPALLMEMHTIARELGMEGPHVEQTWYNMLGRARLERDLVPLFRRYGMGTTVYQPLAGGFLTGKYLDGIPDQSRFARGAWMQKQLTPERLDKCRQLKQVADDLGMPMARLAIAWTQKNPDVSTAIVGARTPEQIRENLQALQAVDQLDEEVMGRIAEILGDQLQI